MSDQPTKANSTVPKTMARQRQSILVFFLTTALGVLALRELNGDYFWLLAAGRHISFHGLSAADPFATLNHGRAWLNQQWLFEVVLWQGKQIIGERGIVLIAVALLAATASLVWAMVNNPRLRIISYLLTLGSLAAIIDVRAAGAGLLIFTATIYLLRSNWRLRYCLIVALFVIWANLHGSVIAGLMLLALVCLGQLLAGHRPWSLGITLMACAAASLLNPAGIEIYHYILSLSSNPALPSLTSEWQSAFSRPTVLVLTLAFLSMVAICSRRQTRAARAETLVLALAFTALALLASRNVVFLGPLFAYLLANSSSSSDREYGPGWLWMAASATLLALVTIFTPTAKPSADLCPELIDQLPQHLNQRIYLSSAQGSYLLYKRPALKASADGRLENYAPQQLLDNQRITKAWPHARYLADRYGVKTVIVKSERAQQRFASWGYRQTAQAGQCKLMRKR